jgi:integrase/recombinase XerC
MSYAMSSNKHLSESEVQALNLHLASTPGRDALMLKLLLATGARASEMLALTIDSLNAEDQTVLLIGLKGSNDREIPLSLELFTELQSYAKSIEGFTLFPIRLRRLEQIWEANRPIKKKLHSLRHTFAIELYKRTKDLQLVQQALGHRGLRNTMIYATYCYSKHEMRRILVA